MCVVPLAAFLAAPRPRPSLAARFQAYPRTPVNGRTAAKTFLSKSRGYWGKNMSEYFLFLRNSYVRTYSGCRDFQIAGTIATQTNAIAPPTHIV